MQGLAKPSQQAGPGSVWGGQIHHPPREAVARTEEGQGSFRTSCSRKRWLNTSLFFRGGKGAPLSADEKQGSAVSWEDRSLPGRARPHSPTAGYTRTPFTPPWHQKSRRWEGGTGWWLGQRSTGCKKVLLLFVGKGTQVLQNINCCEERAGGRSRLLRHSGGDKELPEETGGKGSH